MTSFYRSQRMASLEIDRIIQAVRKGGSILLSSLILQITASHDVSEKLIRRRVQHWIDSYPDELELRGNEIRSLKPGAKE